MLMNRLLKNICLLSVVCMPLHMALAQRVPNEIENIDFLVTFGPEAHTSWGDDDFIQIFFFSIPEDHKTPVYIRVFDPDTGGLHDEQKGVYNTQVRYSVYGGEGAFSHPDSRAIKPTGNFKAGNLLATKTFGEAPLYDGKWYTFGPFNPQEGEFSTKTGGYIFKIVTEGLSGDDGNLYYYYLSSQPGDNTAIDGANAFTYNYTFRLKDEPGTVAHLYPYVDDNVIAVVQHNFDFDNDGEILVYSVAKNRHKAESGGDNEWKSSKHQITAEERNTSIDIQMVKGKSKNNNVVIYITNEYAQPMPFYNIPIGGPPKYKYDVKVNYFKKD